MKVTEHDDEQPGCQFIAAGAATRSPVGEKLLECLLNHLKLEVKKRLDEVGIRARR